MLLLIVLVDKYANFYIKLSWAEAILGLNWTADFSK